MGSGLGRSTAEREDAYRKGAVARLVRSIDAASSLQSEGLPQSQAAAAEKSDLYDATKFAKEYAQETGLERVYVKSCPAWLLTVSKFEKAQLLAKKASRSAHRRHAEVQRLCLRRQALRSLQGQVRAIFSSIDELSSSTNPSQGSTGDPSSLHCELTDLVNDFVQEGQGQAWAGSSWSNDARQSLQRAFLGESEVQELLQEIKRDLLKLQGLVEESMQAAEAASDEEAMHRQEEALLREILKDWVVCDNASEQSSPSSDSIFQILESWKACEEASIEVLSRKVGIHPADAKSEDDIMREGLRQDKGYSDIVHSSCNALLQQSYTFSSLIERVMPTLTPAAQQLVEIVTDNMEMRVTSKMMMARQHTMMQDAACADLCNESLALGEKLRSHLVAVEGGYVEVEVDFGL
eukprot:g5304.t1